MVMYRLATAAYSHSTYCTTLLGNGARDEQGAKIRKLTQNGQWNRGLSKRVKWNRVIGEPVVAKIQRGEAEMQIV